MASSYQPPSACIFLAAFLVCLGLAPTGWAQGPSPALVDPDDGGKPTTSQNTVLPSKPGNPDNPAVNPDAPVDKRVFGVLPNYRTANGEAPYQPLTTKQKFTIATKDSFDWGVWALTAGFAGLSQLEGSDNNVYGQGLKGYAHRYGINYADQVFGNYFPEAIVPTLFHVDPRYFRKGEGSVGSRTLYAISRIFVCKNDSGNLTFNVNEFIGNPVAALVASSYHPQERTLGDISSEAGSFIISDMIGQVLKEFWPDIKHHFQKHQSAQSALPAP